MLVRKLLKLFIVNQRLLCPHFQVGELVRSQILGAIIDTLFVIRVPEIKVTKQMLSLNWRGMYAN